MAVAAAMTSAMNKSRRLRSNMFLCGVIGLIIYILIFKVLWDLGSSERHLTYRAAFVLIWMLADIPFSFYFPYALICYVIPEQDEPEDFIKAGITLWTNFPRLFMRVVLHWREIQISEKVAQPGQF